MQVAKIEDPEGTLTTVELTSTGDENFKVAIGQWIQNNYPDWGYQGFFQRLTRFQAGSCTLNMRE